MQLGRVKVGLNRITVLREQCLESGKPTYIIDKMIEGKIRKFFEEVVLLEQTFILDGKTKIKQVIEDLKLKHKVVRLNSTFMFMILYKK